MTKRDEGDASNAPMIISGTFCRHLPAMNGKPERWSVDLMVEGATSYVSLAGTGTPPKVGQKLSLWTDRAPRRLRLEGPTKADEEQS